MFTIEKRKAEVTQVPVPKRKRSSFAHGKSRSSSTPPKGPLRVSGEDSSGVKFLLGAKFNSDTYSKQRKKVKGNEASIEAKVKASKSYHDDDTEKSEVHGMKSPDNTKPTDKSKSNNLKSSIGSAKKLKRKTIG